MTFVFPHVPKCGGTSLLKHIEGSPLSTYIDYDAWGGAPMHRRNKEVTKLDFTVFDLIYGHFPIGRYRGNQKFKYIALVRDPIERCLSHFNYARWRWESGLLPARHPASQYARMIAEGEMDFVEFLRVQQQVPIAYKLFLGRWDSSRFAMIGQVERYGAFIDALNGLLGTDFTNSRREREALERAELSSKQRADAREILADEYAWYDEFIKASV